MALMDILAKAQGGALFQKVAQALEIDGNLTKRTMGRLCPAIAEKLRDRAKDDPDIFESLLNIIEDNGQGSPLDAGEELAGPESIADGNAVLEEIYGSRNGAIVEMRKLAGEVPETALPNLSAISAAAVVAALAQSNRALPLAGAQQAAEGGLIGTIVGALVKGALQGAMRQLAPRRRRRRSYSSYWGPRRRKRTARRRRSSSISIEDIFADILGSRRS